MWDKILVMVIVYTLMTICGVGSICVIIHDIKIMEQKRREAENEGRKKPGYFCIH